MSHTTVSAVVIAQDNADTIERCVRSLTFADEVVVVDGGSADDTVGRARALGAVVYENPWPGFARQWQYAIDRATGDWVFMCATDEEASPELAGAAREAVDRGGDVAAFRVRRRNQFLGRWMDYGPWADDRGVRLFRKDRGRIAERGVHEGPLVDGPAADLDGALYHYTHATLAESVRRLNRYTTLEAVDRVDRRRVGLVDAYVPPAGVFLKYFLVKGCWRAGVRGYLLAAITAMYKSVLYLKIFQLQSAARRTGGPG